MEAFRPLVERIRRLAMAAGLGASHDDIFDEWEVDKLNEAFAGLEGELEKFGLDAALDRVERLNLDRLHESKGSEHAGTRSTRIQDLLDIMEGQLGRRFYIFVPIDIATYYSTPAIHFPNSLKQFPSIETDVNEACRCYAVERYTACVFHCMGILQAGLRSLATELAVSFSFKLELAEWENVIEQIEKKINSQRSQPKSDKKDKDLTFFSQLAVQFRYFKDAWRNHVAHLREEYDKDQAHSILVHVRDFMEKASTRLKEIPVPIDTP